MMMASDHFIWEDEELCPENALLAVAVLSNNLLIGECLCNFILIDLKTFCQGLSESSYL